MNIQIIRKPIITEKSMHSSSKNEYVFAVNRLAKKNQLKEFIEKKYGVTVEDIRTSKLPGNRKRVGKRRKEVKESDTKKAIIKIKDGQKIEVFETKSKK
jgi:large subunit ribosomal protein L23